MTDKIEVVLEDHMRLSVHVHTTDVLSHAWFGDHPEVWVELVAVINQVLRDGASRVQLMSERSEGA